jgi:hypothetical protein
MRTAPSCGVQPWSRRGLGLEDAVVKVEVLATNGSAYRVRITQK